jgi:uncharacterized surface protein with fasciclin (FAS1) repeats
MGEILGDIEIIRPLNEMTATEVLASEGRFDNFVRALELSGVGGMLEKKGPHTIFAPTDDLFNASTAGGMQSAMKLDDMLSHLIVAGKYMAADLRRLETLKTISGQPLSIRDGIVVNGTKIIKPDIPYDKGIIHEIDVLYDT